MYLTIIIMNAISKLNADIVNQLSKQLSNQLKIKIDNINKASVDGPCSSQRMSQAGRVLIPYDIIIKNNITLNQLETHTQGITVELPFKEYKKIKNSKLICELESYLLDNIGEDGTVSCIITIRGEKGYSGSTELREQYKDFEIVAKEKNWEPIIRKKELQIKHGDTYIGNEKWRGQYYYNIRGGEQDTLESHKDETLVDYQIFTTYKGFMANESVITDVKTALIYQMIHCYDITKYISLEKLIEYKKTYSEYLKKIYYLGKNVYEFIHNIENGIIINDKLMSPITEEMISIEQFNKKDNQADDCLQISHNEACNKQKIYFDEDRNCLVSDYRPTNLFWETKLGNMQQQSFTIKEYWINQQERINRRNKRIESQNYTISISS